MTSRINTESSDPLSILIEKFDSARPNTEKHGSFLYGFVWLSEGRLELVTIQRETLIDDIEAHIEFMNASSDEDNKILFCAAQLSLFNDIDDVLGRYIDAFGAPFSWNDLKRNPILSPHCLMALKPVGISGYLPNPYKKPPDLQVVAANPELERTTQTGELKKASDRDVKDKMFAAYRKSFLTRKIKPANNVFIYDRDRNRALMGKFKNQAQIRCVQDNPDLERSPPRDTNIKLAIDNQNLTPIASLSFQMRIRPAEEGIPICHLSDRFKEQKRTAYIQSQCNHSLKTQAMICGTGIRGVINHPAPNILR